MEKKRTAKAQFRQPQSGPGGFRQAEIASLEEAALVISQWIRNSDRMRILHAEMQLDLTARRKKFLRDSAALDLSLHADFARLERFREKRYGVEKTVKTPCGDLCYHGGNTKVVELHPEAAMEDVTAALEARHIRVRIKKEVDKEAVKEAVAADPKAIAGLENLLSIQSSKPTFTVRTPDGDKRSIADIENLRADTSVRDEKDPKPKKVA